MGLPVTVYRYTDAGAPQLVNGTAPEWINILKKVLVDGYGVKLPLGWTLEFDEGLKVAFRNATTDGGSGGYFQFSGADSSNTTCIIKVSESMGGIDSFIKSKPHRGLQNNGNYRGWEIIGTKRGFYVILHRTNNLLMSDGTNAGSWLHHQMYFVGDIESFYPNDQSAFTLISGTAGLDSSSNHGVNNNVKYARFYDTDGGNGTDKEYSTIDPFIGNNNLLAFNKNAEVSGVKHILSPYLLAVTYNTIDRNGEYSTYSVIAPYVRGKITGMYSSQFMGYRNDTWPIDVSMNGVMHTLLRAQYSPHIWINTEQWYE